MTDNLSPREQVWIAMSNMFLDSDIADMVEEPARVLAASPYDMSTLDRILLEEVYPVCASNLRSVAGAWIGFDEEELITKIAAHNARNYPLLWLWMPFRRRAMRSMLPQWPALRQRVETLRR